MGVKECACLRHRFTDAVWTMQIVSECWFSAEPEQMSGRMWAREIGVAERAE